MNYKIRVLLNYLCIKLINYGYRKNIPNFTLVINLYLFGIVIALNGKSWLNMQLHSTVDTYIAIGFVPNYWLLNIVEGDYLFKYRFIHYFSRKYLEDLIY